MTKTKIIVLLSVAALAISFIGCEKKVPLAEGDMAWCQYYQGEGNMWEPVKVISIDGDNVVIEWEDTFMKDEPQTEKHVSEVIKKERPDPKKLKEGTVVIIHHPSFLYPYKGIISKIEDDRYIVKYKSGSVEREDDVAFDALWKYE